VVSFTSRPLYTQGESPWYPLDRRLGGPQSCSRRNGEEKNSQPLAGNQTQNPDCPACSPTVNTKFHQNLPFGVELLYAEILARWRVR